MVLSRQHEALRLAHEAAVVADLCSEMVSPEIDVVQA
jgi:hypothetical protein